MSCAILQESNAQQGLVIRIAAEVLGRGGLQMAPQVYSARRNADSSTKNASKADARRLKGSQESQRRGNGGRIDAKGGAMHTKRQKERHRSAII